MASPKKRWCDGATTELADLGCIEVELEVFEGGGHWWLAGSPDHRISGTLRIDERGQATLSLIGSLRDLMHGATETVNPDGSISREASGRNFEQSGAYGRVLGQIGSREYTLDGCRRASFTTNLFQGIPTETLTASRVYSGVWLAQGEEALFDEAEIELQWLAFWLRESALREQFKFVDGGIPEEVRLSAIPLDKRSCRPWKGWTVSLEHSIGVSGDQVTSRSLTQAYSLSVRTRKVVPVDDLLNVVSDLASLVSIGVHRPVGIDKVTLTNPNWHGRPGHRERRFLRKVELIVPWRVRDNSAKPTLMEHEMAFTFPQIGGLTGVRRWLRSAAEHQDALVRVMATHSSPHMFVSDRLLNNAAALEAFDRSRHPSKRTHFRTRLLNCVEFAGVPFAALVLDTEQWASRVRDERNDAAHTLGLGSDAAEQYFLGLSCYWLFVLCILRECGMPRAVFDHLGDYQQLHWLRDRLRDMNL